MIKFTEFMPREWRGAKFTGLLHAVVGYLGIIRANLMHMDSLVQDFEKRLSRIEGARHD